MKNKYKALAVALIIMGFLLLSQGPLSWVSSWLDNRKVREATRELIKEEIARLDDNLESEGVMLWDVTI